MSVAGLSHVGIVVPDLAEAAARFAERLGVEPGPVFHNAEQGVDLVQFDLGNARLELLSPTGPGALARFLERNPRGGLHHLGLFSDALEPDLAALAEKDVRCLSGPSTNVFGRPFAFLHPADLSGVLIELEER